MSTPVSRGGWNTIPVDYSWYCTNLSCPRAWVEVEAWVETCMIMVFGMEGRNPIWIMVLCFPCRNNWKGREVCGKEGGNLGGCHYSSPMVSVLYGKGGIICVSCWGVSDTEETFERRINFGTWRSFHSIKVYVIEWNKQLRIFMQYSNLGSLLITWAWNCVLWMHCEYFKIPASVWRDYPWCIVLQFPPPPPRSSPFLCTPIMNYLPVIVA
jgi:hypothetical protein